MKNIHVVPTNKPSRLWTNNLRRRLELDEFPEPHPNQIAKHIYISSDEEIKEGWILVNGFILRKVDYIDGYMIIDITGGKHHNSVCEKIIITTDQDLIEDGIQAIPDEFLEWFVKNTSCEEVEVKHKEVIQYGNMTMYDHNGDGSHYFCKECEVETSRSKEELLKFGVEYYKIIIPKEEPKQETFIKAVDGDGEWLSPVATERAWQEEKLVEIFEHYPNASPKWQYLNGLIQNSLDAKEMEAKLNTSNVTRVEVIQHSEPFNGRAYTKRGAKDVEIQLQDDGKTLKIFLK